jgi:tricorn protease
MQKESRAIAAFGTLGVLFVAGVFIVPKLVQGASGVEGLPIAGKDPSPELVTPNQKPPTMVPRLFGAPTLSKTQIAFAFAGEIWTVPRDGGTARRLVVGQQRNEAPIFSPDGAMIAFTGTYDYNTDVYVVPATGGEARRLTYQPGNDTAVGWTPDGTKILFRSDAHTRRHLPQLYTVPMTGGLATELPLPSGTAGSYSADGTHLAYSPYNQWEPGWKRYRGGQFARIWLADLADSKITKLPKEGANDRAPMWIDNTIYFLSDRDGQVGLYAFDIGGKDVRELYKDPDGFDLRSARAGPGGIVIERVGRLAIYDFATKQAKPVDVTIVDDLPQTRVQFEHVSPDQILHASLGPAGKRVLVEARGEVLSVPVDKGDARNLTQSPGIADRDPAWSPDGKWIAWLSDRSGEYALYFMSPDGLGDAHVVQLAKGFYFSPRWSPDSKKVVVTDNRLNLWLVDVDHPTVVKLDTNLYEEDDLDPSWSPDSKWIAYVKNLPNNLHAAFVYSLDRKQSKQITDGRSDVHSPRFDRSGKYLWFIASTDTGLGGSPLDMSALNHTIAANVYGIVLRKDLPSPVAPESDDEGSAMPVQAKPDDNATRIDFDAIDQRIVALPIERANYRRILTGTAGVLFVAAAPLGMADEDAVENDGTADVTISRFDLKTRKLDKFVDHAAVASLSLSADGGKLLYATTGMWYVVGTDAPPTAGTGAVANMTGLEVRVDPRAEWKQMFHEVWRLERDFLYDEHAHGLDLAAAERVYAPFVDGIASRDDLNDLFVEMLSNLVLGHVFVRGGAMPPQHYVSVGMLGADYTIDHDHYRFAHIYHGENYTPGLVAPLTQPGVVVHEGDYLLGVNGRAVIAGEAVERAFLDTAGKQTTITVAASPDGHDKRDVTVVPVSTEGELRERSWIESNRLAVEQLSGGKLAYVFVPDTLFAGLASFDRYFFSQVDKQGVVIDERFNDGGQIADFIINVLSVKPSLVLTSRTGALRNQPGEAIFGPKVMLANESSGSGGDALPWLFKRAKLGPVIGTRTWGGFVGFDENEPRLIDGGVVTVPNEGLFDAENHWVIENEGTPPDIEVEQDPALVRQGHDPQLERAVLVAMDALKANPPPVFKRPEPRVYPPRLPHPSW